MKTIALTLLALLALAGCGPSDAEIAAQNRANDAKVREMLRAQNAKQQQELRDASARFNTEYAK